jgi:GntR family transcriptional regulator, rspAB operon transcriptional repressor
VAVERVSDVAYTKLFEMILDLRIAPGAFVNENALAAELGLGRVPVREALARLVNDRLVTVLPRRGTMVTGLALDDVLDMFAAREAIECGVAYIAATRATDEDLAELRRLVARVDEDRAGIDYDQFLRDDHDVHMFLIDMVRNPLLKDAADRLLLHSTRFWRFYWRQRPLTSDAMLSHGDLLAAVESRDPVRSEEAMRHHLQQSRHLVQQLF